MPIPGAPHVKVSLGTATSDSPQLRFDGAPPNLGGPCWAASSHLASLPPGA